MRIYYFHGSCPRDRVCYQDYEECFVSVQSRKSVGNRNKKIKNYEFYIRHKYRYAAKSAQINCQCRYIYICMNVDGKKLQNFTVTR